MKKPAVFVFGDLLPFGFLAIGLILTTVLLFAFSAMIGFSLVMAFGSALASYGYIRIVLRRKSLSDLVLATTSQGVYLLKGKYTADASQINAVEAEIARAIEAWKKVPGVDPGKYIAGTYILFMDFPFTIPDFPAIKMAGHTERNYMWVKGTTCCYVGFKTPPSATALGHELGHVVLIGWKGDPSEATLSALATQYGVPY